MSRSSKTGGNLEPMPFIRKWGNTDDQIGDDANQMAYVNDGLKEVPKKHRHREHSKSPTKKEKRRSRSPEKKRHKKRSKSREGKSRKRSHSRERGSIKREKEAQDSNEQHMSAFPPPVNLMQQVQQQQRQQQIQIQYEQQQTIQFKQEYYNQNVPMQQVPQQQYEQKSWQQPIKQYQQSQQVEEKPPANDALSAALAAAAMVAQKLNKSHGPGGATASSDLLNKLQQAPGRNNPTADSILAKEQITVKSEFGQEQQQDETDEQRRERRRKSRWSSAKAFVPGMPTILPADIDETQRQIYLLQMDIEETTRRLRQGDFGQNVDPSERSPSPEPIYDATGKRLNTREIRKRQELEQRRHEKIQAILKLNPNYKPPADYRPPNIKLHDKVWIPQEEHPQINFVGLLIGPRGNTLKALEAETGCKIIIRGKGSIKEGKLANRTGPLPGENEPLHAYVTATDRDAIKRGCERIREIVNAALMIPDGQNELRKLQLRELALLNGTLRPEDVLSGARCSNCGSDQHKTWECMEAPNVTANVICTACGGAGHIAKDCKNPKAALDPGLIDSEYSALMAELGEKPPGAVASLASVGVKPVPLGSFSIPGSSNVRPHFNLPTQTPIVRVNLAKPRPSQQPATAGYPAWAIDGPNTFYGFSGLPGQDPAAAAAAWAAWQGYPTPVPPPPGNVSESETDTSHGMPANTSIGGLAMFPPPPPPPPPVPKSEITEDFGSIFSAPPPPQS